MNVGLAQALQNYMASKAVLFENVLKGSIFRMFLISQLSDTHVIRTSIGQLIQEMEIYFIHVKWGKRWVDLTIINTNTLSFLYLKLLCSNKQIKKLWCS